MREDAFFHARDEDGVEFQALRGMHGHERHRGAVFYSRIQVGTQRDPFDEVGKRIGTEHAYRRILGIARNRFGRDGLGSAFQAFRIARGRARHRGGELGFVHVVGFGVFIDNAQEFADVLDAAARLVGAHIFQLGQVSAAVDDHLHHAAQFTGPIGGVVYQVHEFADGTARLHPDALVRHGEQAAFHEGAALACGNALDTLDGGLADTALGNVDHALGGHVVRWIDRKRQIGHDVADFLAIEESGAADDAVGHACTQQHIFEHAGLRIGAVEHRHLVVAVALGVAPFDLARDPAAFIAFVCSHVDLHLVAFAGIGDEALFLALGIVGDHRIRRRKDVAGRTVIAFQLDRAAVGVVLLEIQDVADIGTAPAVNGLVVVAYHHDVAILSRQQIGDGVLRAIGVLVFVH